MEQDGDNLYRKLNVSSFKPENQAEKPLLGKVLDKQNLMKVAGGCGQTTSGILPNPDLQEAENQDLSGQTVLFTSDGIHPK
ncbi:hypothetical protein [Thalassomonas haliotis]|uniref:Uncharacterized protein n=1 Tax=Thalassomonas haliotis TaxID=485448 RepID=A0ABY7VBZ6_9GAMM|nr:hypothetical protein [Thalassomonas haliotis]WDE11056.1 hypothetical protein H3N35_22910 [Thalassomonas haliotis]